LRKIASAANLLTRDEAFLIAVNITKLPRLARQILKDIPRDSQIQPAGTIEREAKRTNYRTVAKPAPYSITSSAFVRCPTSLSNAAQAPRLD
jgi:hypothetical protein